MELASRPGKMPSWHSPSDNTRTDRWCTSRSFAPTLQASMHCLHSQHHPYEHSLNQLARALACFLVLLPEQGTNSIVHVRSVGCCTHSQLMHVGQSVHAGQYTCDCPGLLAL